MKKSKSIGGPVTYENSIKIAIAREHVTSDLGYQKLAAKHGLSKATVQYFVKWYRAKYPDGIVPPDTPNSKPNDTDKALKEANLKIAALEMLIENAGRELGVDLVKKHGTKPSRK